jgi:hypothetical protein
VRSSNRASTQHPRNYTHVVFALLEDVAQEILHVVLPEGVLQVLGARQDALYIYIHTCLWV